MKLQRRPGPKRIASSISAAVATPSLTSHSASRHSASIRRSATNPSISFDSISGCMPMLRYISAARCLVVSDVAAPPQTSTSGMRYTGLNGWPTTSRSGLTMSRCISVGSKPEVDEPKITSAPATRLAAANNCCFNSSRSGALSCTKWAPSTASSTVVTIRSEPSAGHGPSSAWRWPGGRWPAPRRPCVVLRDQGRTAPRRGR